MVRDGEVQKTRKLRDEEHEEHEEYEGWSQKCDYSLGGVTFCTPLVPHLGYMGYIYKSGVQSGVHVTCKFPPVRVRGGRGPIFPSSRERAAAGRTRRSRAGDRRGTGRTEQNKMKQTDRFKQCLFPKFFI